MRRVQRLRAGQGCTRFPRQVDLSIDVAAACIPLPRKWCQQHTKRSSPGAARISTASTSSERLRPLTKITSLIGATYTPLPPVTPPLGAVTVLLKLPQSSQAKVQGLVTQIQQLQQAVECLELQKKRSAAEVQALDDYISSRACWPAPVSGKQQLGQTPAEPAETRKVRAGIWREFH